MPRSKLPGIYMIYCHANKKAYIGSSKCTKVRLKAHKHMLRHNIHGNQHIQNAWNLHGEPEFSFGLLQQCEDVERLQIEQVWLDIWISSGMAFNRQRIAGSPKGTKWTDEEKAAASARMKANPTFKGRKHTEETKSVFSAQAKARLAVPSNNPFYGRTHTEEAKMKISAANRGNNYCVGRVVSDKCKAAISEANKRRAAAKRKVIESMPL